MPIVNVTAVLFSVKRDTEIFI